MWGFRSWLMVTLVLGMGGVVSVQGQTFQFTSVPDGFEAGSLQLPGIFTGALGVDPNNPDVVFASVGSFQDDNLARVNLKTGTGVIVADGPFGNIAGIAVLSSTRIVIVDNSDALGGLPGRTLLLATDQNGDGDFDDTGEIEELIAPILVDGPFGFSGAQARVAPFGNASKIPGGSVLVQTADGNGKAEILVVRDPLSMPRFVPADSAYFSGFDFNGGFDFDSNGNLIVGSATITNATFFDFDGEVTALVNTNGDEDIDPGESHILLPTSELPNSISDLVVDREDDAFLTSGGDVLSFHVPADPLTTEASVEHFVSTDSFFLSAVLINTKDHPFAPFAGPGGATLVIGDGIGTTNLLTLTPASPSADLNNDGIVNSKDLLILLTQWQTVTGP